MFLFLLFLISDNLATTQKILFLPPIRPIKNMYSSSGVIVANKALLPNGLPRHLAFVHEHYPFELMSEPDEYNIKEIC